MHAIRQYAFGSADNLLYEEVPDPRPAEGQVRIAVDASGVHLIDISIRQGRKGGPFPLPVLPMTPGREVAGVVDEVGPGVDRSWVGRRAVAHLGMDSGGYAERAVAAVTALHEIPAELTADAAVTMIGTGRTTVGILEVAALRAGDVVLVTAAAGGIGSLIVPAARHAGATVVGLAGGSAKVELVLSLGADHAFDYLEAGWPDRVLAALGDRPTVALDGVGGTVGRQAKELLGVGGRLVLFGFASGVPTEVTADDLFARGLTAMAAIGPRVLSRAGGLRPLEARALAEAAAGRLAPKVGSRFALSRAADAHRAMEARATLGKTILVP
jgi:NADPH:quinone reductase